MLWRILVQFLFRTSFGLALAMAMTSPKNVTSGFFRNHLWVLLGVNTFAGVVVFLTQSEFVTPTSLLIGAAISAALSYFGAIFWLYEKHRVGIVLLAVLAIAGFVLGTLLDANPNSNSKEILIVAIDTFTSGAVIGFTFASMLLGHWYLNTPTMKLDPLKRLLVGLGVAIVARMLFCAVGVAYQFVQPAAPDLFVIGAICLRWLAGLVGLLVMTIMSWQTLKIPNTQSATGILYVGVIFVFIGELASRLLSVQSSFPL